MSWLTDDELDELESQATRWQAIRAIEELRVLRRVARGISNSARAANDAMRKWDQDSAYEALKEWFPAVPGREEE